MKWDIFDFPEELFVKIEEEYLKEIISSIGSQHEVARKIGIKHPTLHRYIRGRRISLKRLFKIMNLSPKEGSLKKKLEKHIIDIKAPSSRANEIEFPFSLEMCKPLARILGHIMADENIRRSNGHNIRYGNTDPVLVESFVKDMEEMFNNVKYSKRVKDYQTESGTNKFTEVTYPSTLGRIFIELFGSFGTFDGKVPEVVINSEKGIISEFLKVFFDDEGTISGDALRIQIANKTSINQIRDLFYKLGIEPKLNSFSDRGTIMYSLSIYKMESRKLFWKRVGATKDSKKYLKLEDHIKKLVK